MRSIALAIVFLSLVALAPAADDPKQTDDFPRRALFIQVNHPLYLNPLTAAPPLQNRGAIDKFAASLRIPTWKTNNQLFILSDNLPPPDDRIPTKAAILAAIRHFSETSRIQDRILVYFRGHAFEKSDKAYFAPVEGEAADLNTLIPVTEIYDLLNRCRATQKVVVWDVCPRNQEHPAFRPASGPLTLELLLALAAAPGGVQAVVPCLPSEYSLEYTTPKGDTGSALFDSLRKAFEENAAAKKPTPADPIPIVEAFPTVEKYVDTAAKALGAKQTPKLVGKPHAMLAAIDPKEVFPAAVMFPVPKSPAIVEIKAIFSELALPPLVIGQAVDPIPLLPFDPLTLKPYLPDVSTDDIFREAEKYPLRVVVLRALQTIRDTRPSTNPKDPKLIVSLNSPVSEQVKRNVLSAQGPLAVTIAKLEDELAALEAIEKLRAKEPKRWQANYDYAVGQLRLRLALLNEYNLALGHVRTESLPDLPAGSTGWRLTHTEKMLSKKNVQELADAARKTFEGIIAANKGTPWEVLAKRALLTPPGLRWEPVAK